MEEQKEQDQSEYDKLSPEGKEALKEIVIARIKQMPDNFRLSIG